MFPQACGSVHPILASIYLGLCSLVFVSSLPQGSRFVPRLVWSLFQDLPDLGDPTSSYATIGIAFGTLGHAHPFPRHGGDTMEGL